MEMLIRPQGIKLPIKSKSESKARVVKVAAGRAHTLALTNENEIFSLGKCDCYNYIRLVLVKSQNCK